MGAARSRGTPMLSMHDKSEPRPKPGGGVTAGYVLLSLAVAWPSTWFWLSELRRARSTTVSLIVAVPLRVTAVVAVVWALFVLVIWRRGRKSHRSDEWNLEVLVAGPAAVASWFAFPLLVFLTPLGWLGIGHSGIAIPNPLGLLGAIVVASVVTWLFAKMISASLMHGPTPGLTVSLLIAAALSCGSVVFTRTQDEARRKDLEATVQSCHIRNYASGPDGTTTWLNQCFNLAEQARTGDGVPRDVDRAVQIYTWGCMHREIASCTALGSLYESGDGVRKDFRKAFELYETSCRDGSKEMCVEMARMMREGVAPIRDAGRADTLWASSCGQAPQACTRIGFAYENGLGVKQDRRQAVTLFDLACRAGDEAGCESSKRLNEK